MEYKKVVSIKLPTDIGKFQLVAYQNSHPDVYHLALIMGNVKNKDKVLVRIHSSCITGDIFGSLRCDCGLQLQSAMKTIAKEGCGIILYLFQEGRGIGLLNKLRAYKLQERGADTVEANIQLGLPVDSRSYLPAAEILKDLGVESIQLLTNNPDKVRGLRKLGINIAKRVQHETKPVGDNAKYLKTKREKLGHYLNLV